MKQAETSGIVPVEQSRGEDERQGDSPENRYAENRYAENKWKPSVEKGAPRMLMVATIAATVRGFLLPYARHLRAQGWEVDCLASGATSCDACVSEFDTCWEAEWSRNPLGKEGLLHAPAKVRELVDRQGYDVVHVHTPVASFLTRYALRRRAQGRPAVVYTAHGFHFHPGGGRLRNLAFYSLEKLASRWTDYLVLINEEDHRAAIERGFGPPERIVRMPGIGVDVDAYAGACANRDIHDEVCAELRIPESARLISMVAEFIPRKRHRDLLHAFAKLGDRQDVHLIFAGSGPDEIEAEILAFKLGIFERVHFLGVRPDVARLLAASTLSVLPSAQEGLPRAVMESLCVGVPVVATDIRGTRELLQSGAGRLVAVGAVDALARAIAGILDDPHERQRMGRRGREVIAAYDLSRTIELHDRLYERALAGVPVRSPVPAGSQLPTPATSRAG